MIDLLIIPLAGILAGYAGGSLPYSQKIPNALTWLPEFLFALLLSSYIYLDAGYIITALVTAWVYIWMQTGHANALNRGRNADPKRSNTLTPLVDWIGKRIGITNFGRAYSFLFFGVKGFIMGLPLGGFIPGLLWPLAYDIGSMTKKHWISEVLSGVFIGAWAYVLVMLLN